MMLGEVGVGKASSGRKLTGRGASQVQGARAIATKIVATDGAQMNGSSGEGGHAANGKNHIAVTFWGPDGNCYDGMSPHVASKFVFVESKQLVPVDTEVTIGFIVPSEVVVDQGVGKGTVV